MANVQISEELFCELYKYFCLDNEDVFQKCKDELQIKFDKIVNRNLYTKYKTSATDEEREKARQEYLDRIGIHDNFRY